MSDNNNEKLFTQEEVNNLISERIKKVKANTVSKEKAEELTAKEKELNKRLLKLSFKEHLIDNNLPLDYMEIIGNSESLEEFSNKAEKISAFKKARAPYGECEPVISDKKKDPFTSLAHAKHIPKKF